MLDDRPTSYLVIFTVWSQKSLISQAFPNYFLFRGIVTQGCLGSQRINAIVSSYLSLLDLQSSPTVLPLSLSHHVDPNSSPSKVILPHFFYFWICWFLLGQQGPGVNRRNQNTKYVEPMPFHKIPFGGDVESCTRVHNAFATKELQQYRYYTTQLFMCQLLSLAESQRFEPYMVLPLCLLSMRIPWTFRPTLRSLILFIVLQFFVIYYLTFADLCDQVWWVTILFFASTVLVHLIDFVDAH